MAITGSTKKNVKHGSVVHNCTCVNKFQDKQYGHGKRLHNLCVAGTKIRCTVCGDTKGV